MGITAHIEVEFDTVGAEPNPWWKPFIWWRLYRDESHSWQAVLRFGVLGFHIGFSFARHGCIDS